MPIQVPLLAYPRSGVTFLRHVLEAVYGVQTRSVYPEPDGAQGGLLDGDRQWKFEDQASYTGTVLFVKSHETNACEHPGDCICLTRDGRDTLCSHVAFDMRWGMAAEMPQVTAEHVLEQLIRGTWPRPGNLPEGCDEVWNWTRHCQAALNRTAPTAYIRFEDLIADPVTVVCNACDELELPLVPSKNYEIQTFKELHARDPDFFQKGKVGRWREDMPERLHKLFWQHHGEMMDRLGYTRAMARV